MKSPDVSNLSIIVVMYVCSFFLVSVSDNFGCDELGGVCTETYKGCDGGRFERGLCAGPVYTQCCVLYPSTEPGTCAGLVLLGSLAFHRFDRRLNRIQA